MTVPNFTKNIRSFCLQERHFSLLICISLHGLVYPLLWNRICSIRARSCLGLCILEFETVFIWMESNFGLILNDICYRAKLMQFKFVFTFLYLCENFGCHTILASSPLYACYIFICFNPN